MSKKKSRPKTCAHCGKKKTPWNDDHIPPLCLFANRHNSKVPSCIDCNNGASQDDEYFRNILSFRASTASQPSMGPILNAANRALSKPQQQSFLKSLQKKVRWAPSQTNSGIILPDQPELEVEMKRIHRVATRIISGLFFLNKGFPVPSSHQIVCMAEEILQDISLEKQEDILLAVYELCVKSPEFVVGSANEFNYRFGFVPSVDQFTSKWLLFFHKEFAFFGAVVPKMGLQGLGRGV